MIPKMETNRNSLIRSLVQILIFLTILMQADPLSSKKLLFDDDNVNLNNVDDEKSAINVGVILDMGSVVGKMIHTCIITAVSDFYAVNHHYRTRIVLQLRDSEGIPFRALSSEEKYLSFLGNKAKVPTFSFFPSLATMDINHHIIRVSQGLSSQFEAIAALAKSLKWIEINVIVEDIDYKSEVLSCITESFKSKNINISYVSTISSSSLESDILGELYKLMKIGTSVYLVHLSPVLASRFLLVASKLGMFEHGRHTWIMTEETMNCLHLVNHEILEQLQGCIGFKPHIPSSTRLKDVGMEWKKYIENDKIGLEELSFNAVLAYDIIWAIAEAIERISNVAINSRDLFPGMSSLELENFVIGKYPEMLVDEISRVKFEGLSGEFQMKEGKLNSKEFSILNLEDGKTIEVGLWNPDDGIRGNVYSNAKRKCLEEVGSPAGPKAILGDEKKNVRLRIGIPDGKKFDALISVYQDPQTNAISVTGFCFDVFRTAMEALNYEVTFDFVILTNGTYSEYVTRVHDKELDVMIGDVTITGNRTLFVDFSAPYTDLGIGTVARLNDADSIWLFLKPLDTKLWIATAVFIIVTGFTVSMIERYHENEEFEGSTGKQIGIALFFGFSTLVFAHREHLKSNLSRMLVVVWLFVVLILISTYTASLSSLLTLQQIHFKSTTNKYIGISSGGLVRGLVVNNMNFQNGKLRPYHTLNELAEALDTRIEDGGVAAVVDEIPYIKLLLAKYPGKYALIETIPTTNGFAFVFQKGSSMVPEVSRAVLRLREEGKLALMEHAWFNSETTLLPEDQIKEPNTLSFDRFRGLFLISGICTFLAMVITIFKMVLYKLQLEHLLVKCLDRGNLYIMMMIISDIYQRDSSSTASTTSVHVTALDGLVNVNSLFTIAVFVGLSLTIPGQRSLEERTSCDAGIDVIRKLLVFEVVSFSFFLFSSLVAQGLKLAINLLNSKDVDEGFRAHINLRVLRFGMLGSAIGSVMGCLFLMLSMVNVIQIRLGMLSCGSKSAVQATTALVVLVSSALLVYISTAFYAFTH
ncbi:hypothetical protein Leryth_000803 [Lithospermum erythrorhizon]|nr:hypothetical protein Leryth_000803 [Lithospermum erythrorhizon]